MGWLWWIIGIIVGLILLLFALSWTYVEGKVHIRREKKNDSLTFEFKALFGLIRHEFDIPVVELINMNQGVEVKSKEENTNKKQTVGKKKRFYNFRTIQKSLYNFQKLYHQTRGLNRWLKQTLSNVECRNFYWDTRIGIGDAPDTAMLVGAIWAVKTTLLGWLFRYIQLEKPPKLSVSPQYNQLTYSTELLITLRIRIFYILLSRWRLILRLMQSKGGMRTWKRIFRKNRKAAA
ncbi:DUF2953 domain-containing protein [Paenibacillus sp. N1-5-1-14]|uniref:DUF2953 domain-containing protein n=1 Tax=Paenibacillus radicibacter TaxID=2972488 RepID=UPI002159B362|nr:DUF2953 domain-containing protein [Paenibacillus radicibacter]MCR8642343.1 DUF2953 domain-containing protein [Paenibacillus radicibacter]